MPNTKLQGASICKFWNLEVFQKGIHILLCSTGKIQSSLLSFKIQLGRRRGWWNTSYEKLSWPSMGRTESTMGINCCNFRNCHDFLQSSLQWKSQKLTFFSGSFGRVFLYVTKYSLKDDSSSYSTGKLGTRVQTYRDTAAVLSNMTVIAWLDSMYTQLCSCVCPQLPVSASVCPRKILSWPKTLMQSLGLQL